MPSVLIAEDNVILADILEFFLTSAGYQVCGSARTVEESVRLADLHNPDLAVFDCRLADGGLGSDILPKLKNKDRIGILFATGNDARGELTAQDGIAYIKKPYSMKDVQVAIGLVHDFKVGGFLKTTSLPAHFSFLVEPSVSHGGQSERQAHN